MATNQVSCLGVGDGMASADRNRSAYLYQFNGTRLLVDCGEPVSRSYHGQWGAEDLDAILLSHMHSDHVGGLLMLIQSFWLEKRRRLLPVYMPADAVEPIRQMQRATMLFDELLPFPLEFRVWEVGQSITLGPVRVTPRLTSHLEGLRRQFQPKYGGNFETFSFLFETPERRVVHSADLGEPEDLVAQLRDPVDLLVCELAHFSIDQLCNFLRGKSIRQLALTHLGRRYWERFEETGRLVREGLPGQSVLFPADGDQVTF